MADLQRHVDRASERVALMRGEITDKALHAAARELCHQVYGDWRYDPGNRHHAKFRQDALRVLRAAAPFIKGASREGDADGR